MSAAVLVPLSQINLNGGVLPPSAITTQQSPRHGRSRGASIAKGKNNRGRGYSLVDDRHTQVSKAVVFVLKRTAQDEESSEDGKVVADADGWVGVEDVLAHPKVSALGVALSELKEVVASAAGKGRLALRQLEDAKDAEAPASYEIRRAAAPAQPAHEVLSSPSPVWPQIAAGAEDLPEFIVHETSYPKYHLILTSGSIKRAGGQPYLSFAPADDETANRSSSADVSIWIKLADAMAARPESVWRRADNGHIVTSDEVPRALWTKAVARRGDLGVLYENGEVRKEVPVGLRGKGAKAKKGKGVLKSGRTGDDDGSGSASDE
ncbi:uncharacterized protein E0L32_004018 [Thyridium curvatum]|uniref:Uncharacterized protein n=1 Tax=Thyridium curvatum TaxID=1093900 RepID=A0A507BGC5_9PEZI|nr:uncharacterized protein E0L32_004018 [Thyridium curvatum]TPX16369.1 hypothetical protein E0L32_004018 [Thyridium curvatum]